MKIYHPKKRSFTCKNLFGTLSNIYDGHFSSIFAKKSHHIYLRRFLIFIFRVSFLVTLRFFLPDISVRIIAEQITLRKMRPYSELFWSVFSRIWTECEEIRSISQYSVRMREVRARITPNMDTSHVVSMD